MQPPSRVNGIPREYHRSLELLVVAALAFAVGAAAGFAVMLADGDTAADGAGADGVVFRPGSVDLRGGELAGLIDGLAALDGGVFGGGCATGQCGEKN